MRRNNISITEASLDQNLNTRLENLNNLQTQLFPGSYDRLGGTGDIARNVEQLRAARLRYLAPEQMIEVDASIIGFGDSKLSDLDFVQNVEHSAMRACEDPSLPLVDLINPVLENLNVIRFVPTLPLQVENTEGVEEFRQQLSGLSVPTSHSFSTDSLQRLHELASPLFNRICEH
jgi:hypothetical protein